MKSTVNLNSINLVNDDSLSYIKTLPDNCIDLIATDPPYFQVKHVHGITSGLTFLLIFLAGRNVGRVLAGTETKRQLVPVLWFTSGLRYRNAVTGEVQRSQPYHMGEAFRPVAAAKQRKPALFFPSTERILFAEHYQGPVKEKAVSTTSGGMN